MVRAQREMHCWMGSSLGSVSSTFSLAAMDFPCFVVCFCFVFRNLLQKRTFHGGLCPSAIFLERWCAVRRNSSFLKVKNRLFSSFSVSPFHHRRNSSFLKIKNRLFSPFTYFCGVALFPWWNKGTGRSKLVIAGGNS